MLLMKDIIDDKDERIRNKSKEVELPLTNEEHQTLQDMYEFLVNSQDPKTSEKYNLRPAVGIAAIQLGIPKRMCAIYVCDYDEDGNTIHSDSYGLVNPKIVSYTEKKSYLQSGEGCLSVDDEIEGYVPRYAKVTVEGYDILTKSQVRIVARGFLSICLQHELDHFEGILFYDRINKKSPLAPIPDALVID